MTTLSTEALGDSIRPNRLFLLSCISLVVTAMTFAIRAGILGELSTEFSLSGAQLGWVNSMAFLGFPVAMVLLGYLYNKLGPRLIMILAFIGHLLGLGLTIIAGGFVGLLVSTFFIGFANGAVEAACNPMIAQMYEDQKTKWLNRFHVWFPGGIVIGALVSKVMTDMNMGWQMQIAIMIIPTFIYGYMIFTTKFPKSADSYNGQVSDLAILIAIIGLMILIGTPNALTGALPGGIFIPLALILAVSFLLVKRLGGTTRDGALLSVMMVLMTITATSELGTQQWVGSILGESGASPMIILALATGLMAVGRYFAGPVIHALNPLGVLLMSAVITTLGIFLLSTTTGGMVYVATIVFALGVCYFWPTMVGVVGEYIPRTGALGMSLVGGAGLFGLSLWQPIIGGWIDANKAEAVAQGANDKAADLIAGQATLGQLMMFPAVLIVCFGVLYAMKKWISATAE